MASKTIYYSLRDLQDLIYSYLFKNGTSQLEVEAELQHIYLQSIEYQLDSERFFFVVNLEDFTLSYINGVSKWLGYSEASFSLEKFVRIIHPSYKLIWSLFIKNILCYACVGKYSLGFLKQHFSCTLALQHQQGHFLIIKKMASVFQYDSHNRLLAYINECTIIGNNHTLSDFNPRVLDSEKGYLNKNEALFNLVLQDFLSLKIFSVNEIRFAKMLVRVPGIKLTEIAASFGVTVSTIETYSKRFLVKSRDVFKKEFVNSLEAATFLSNSLFL